MTNLNGLINVNAAYDGAQTKQTSKQTVNNNEKTSTSENVVNSNKNSNSEAATCELSNKSKVSNKPDMATIQKLKADAEARNAQLRSLVEKMLVKQGKTYNSSMDIYALLRSGELEVDEETAEKAREDIAEDGYWGVEQTSERLVSFAKALAGNDPEKADEMMAAVKKGFDEATKSWGDKLPDICQRTLDTTLEKLEKWKAELS